MFLPWTRVPDLFCFLCVVVANYLFSCAAAKSAAQLNLHTDLAEK